MKSETIEIFLFIDALGWKIVNDHNFLTDLLPYRKKVDMQFGYSSSAIPTILSGETPAAHGHLGLFRFAPEASPFKKLSRLSRLFKPENFWNRGRVRHHLSRVLKKIYGFTGYFQLYRMPLWKLKYMDYCEKKDLFLAGGMDDIANLHDAFTARKVNFHIADWHLSDDENYQAAERAIESGKNILFVYTGSFDGMLHDQVSDFQAVQVRLDTMKTKIKSLYDKAQEYAENVHFTVFSDHGMTPLTQTVDIMSAIEQTGLVFGRDYGVCYDSTLARFYYLSENSREIIEQLMLRYPGYFLTEDDEKKYGIYREDRIFGDAIFLLDAGIQIIPSDMGGKALNGMHGYSPEDIHSAAAILANVPVPEYVNSVKDYFRLMIERADTL